MNIDVTHLYADKSWVDLDAVLTPDQKHELLERAQAYYESLGVDGIDCSIGIISPISALKSAYEHFIKPKKSKLNKALVVSFDFDPYAFSGIISISTFGGTTVMGTYKVFSRDGESVFGVNHNAEVRRRTVIEKLVNMESVDCFFLIDKSIDVLSEFVVAELKSTIKKSLVGP